MPADDAPTPAETPATSERIEVQRLIPAEPAAIFAILTDPDGHVAIDSSGMLMSSAGDPVQAEGDSFVIHMNREALNDVPMGHYDVTVTITRLVPDREIAWTIAGTIRPPIGHIYGYRLEAAGAETSAAKAENSAGPPTPATLVTSYYDWSAIRQEWRERNIFPVIPEASLRATLGILDRTVARGYPRPGHS